MVESIASKAQARHYAGSTRLQARQRIIESSGASELKMRHTRYGNESDKLLTRDIFRHLQARLSVVSSPRLMFLGNIAGVQGRGIAGFMRESDEFSSPEARTQALQDNLFDSNSFAFDHRIVEVPTRLEDYGTVVQVDGKEVLLGVSWRNSEVVGMLQFAGIHQPSGPKLVLDEHVGSLLNLQAGLGVALPTYEEASLIIWNHRSYLEERGFKGILINETGNSKLYDLDGIQHQSDEGKYLPVFVKRDM